MDYDHDRIDETVLALAYLGLHDGSRVWKSFDRDATSRLHEKGYISDPASRAKSVVLTDEGLREAERLCRKLFGKHSPADTQAHSEPDELRATERRRLRSLVDADMETAHQLHADDFQLVNPLGGSLTKQQYLDQVASGDIDYLEWEPHEIAVRHYGDVAVIRYRAELKIRVRGVPEAPSGGFWHTDVYERRGGRWQVVWSQATRVMTD